MAVSIRMELMGTFRFFFSFFRFLSFFSFLFFLGARSEGNWGTVGGAAGTAEGGATVALEGSGLGFSRALFHQG